MCEAGRNATAEEEMAEMAAFALEVVYGKTMSLPLLKCVTVGFATLAASTMSNITSDCNSLYQGGLPDCVSNFDDLRCLLEDNNSSMAEYQMCGNVTDIVFPFYQDESEFAFADQYISPTLNIPGEFKLRCGSTGRLCRMRRPFLYRSDGTNDVCPFISTEHNSKYQLEGFSFTEFHVENETANKASVDRIVEINSYDTHLAGQPNTLSAKLEAGDLPARRKHQDDTSSSKSSKSNKSSDSSYGASSSSSSKGRRAANIEIEGGYNIEIIQDLSDNSYIVNNHAAIYAKDLKPKDDEYDDEEEAYGKDNAVYDAYDEGYDYGSHDKKDTSHSKKGKKSGKKGSSSSRHEDFDTELFCKDPFFHPTLFLPAYPSWNPIDLLTEEAIAELQDTPVEDFRKRMEMEQKEQDFVALAYSILTEKEGTTFDELASINTDELVVEVADQLAVKCEGLVPEAVAQFLFPSSVSHSATPLPDNGGD